MCDGDCWPDVTCRATFDMQANTCFDDVSLIHLDLLVLLVTVGGMHFIFAYSSAATVKKKKSNVRIGC